MQAMARSLPPQSGQASMSMANTRLRRCAQLIGANGLSLSTLPHDRRGTILVRCLKFGDYEGAITESNRLYLEALSFDSKDAFVRRKLAVNFSAISLFDEARRMSPESDWLVNAYQQRWSEAIELARTNLAADKRSNAAKFNLANVLHMSGDLAGAQSIYEQLQLVNPGVPLIDLNTTSPMATPPGWRLRQLVAARAPLLQNHRGVCANRSRRAHRCHPRGFVKGPGAMQAHWPIRACRPFNGNVSITTLPI